MAQIFCTDPAIAEEKAAAVAKDKSLQDALDLFWATIRREVTSSPATDSLRDIAWLSLQCDVNCAELPEKDKVISGH